ncbi:MAG TPA: hypothetical protein VFC65_00570 [Prolixibacteraceae bacterium]|nr:hypothetical protein [Prolixibacteraceae bacterium]
MIIKTLIISVILVGFVMLALGVKLLFNKDAEFTAHSCALDDGTSEKNEACSKCELKDLMDCPEIKKDLKTENESKFSEHKKF